MDEHAEGAHRGMTVQMEHTPCEDPLTDEASLMSELDIFLCYLCCIANDAIFFR